MWKGTKMKSNIAVFFVYTCIVAVFFTALITLTQLEKDNQLRSVKQHDFKEIELVKWLDTNDLPSGVYSFRVGNGFIYIGKHVQVCFDPLPPGTIEVK
jgi:hypothetical protein